MKTIYQKGTIIGLIFISSLFLLSSCLDDKWDFNKLDDEVELEIYAAAPLVYGTISLADMLNELDDSAYVKSFDDDLLYITYETELLSYTAAEVVDIPDQQIDEIYLQSDIDIPAWQVSLLGDTISFPKQQNGEFTFSNGEKIDSIYLKTITANIHVESTFKHEGILIISSDYIINPDGSTFRKEVLVGNTSGTFSTDVAVSMDGSKVYFDNVTDTSKTYLPIDFELKLINSFNPILATESCEISFDFSDITFSAVYGYLGNYETLLNNGSIDIDLFDEEIEGGEIYFDDPRFTLNIANSYGIPIEIDLSGLSTYSAINDETLNVTFTQPGINPFSIASPTLEEIGQTADSSYLISKENSNIDAVLKSRPNKFNYTIHAQANPAGPGGDYNFVTDSSQVTANLEVVLPLYVRAGGFSIADTSEFNLEDEMGEEIDMLNYLRFTFDITNGFPLGVNAQVYFLDQNYLPLDSMFVDNDLLLEAAAVDDDDKVTNPVAREKSVVFQNDRIQGLKPTKYLLVRATIATTDFDANQYVKIYSYYTMDFNLRARAGAKINSREN